MITLQEFAALTNPQAWDVLDKMSLAELTQFYNLIAVASVNRLKDKPTAMKKIMKTREDLGMNLPSNIFAAKQALASANAVAAEEEPVLNAQEEVDKAAEYEVYNKGKALGGQPMASLQDHAKVEFLIKGQEKPLTFYFKDLPSADEFSKFAASYTVVKQVRLDDFSAVKERIGVPTPTPIDKALASAQHTVPAKREPRVTKPTRREDDSKTIIQLKVTLNPKKPGTATFDRFEKYVDGMTVSQALEAGITREDIRWDAGKGFIVLV